MQGASVYGTKREIPSRGAQGEADDGSAGSTWNPVTGCTKVSESGGHCSAETFAERWRGVPGHQIEQGFDVRLWPERLTMPLQ